MLPSDISTVLLYEIVCIFFIWAVYHVWNGETFAANGPWEKVIISVLFAAVAGVCRYAEINKTLF